VASQNFPNQTGDHEAPTRTLRHRARRLRRCVAEAPAKDDEWFTEQIVVRGKQVTTFVNGKKLVEYTEPEGVQRPADMAQRLISNDTFALQGHDPKSKVYFKNILVKVLP
jgi:hypothetical protein